MPDQDRQQPSGRSPSEAAAETATPPLQRGLALLVAGAYFMEILDSTVIAPAIPKIATDFGVAPVDINVAITAYVLTLGVLIPISGWLADRYGGRWVFCTALAVFALASAGCALAPNLVTLTGARVVQGVGGAMMVPVGRLVVLRTTPKSELVRAIAYLTWPGLLAPVVAPVLGGTLAEYASWRWIFVINVPLGVAGFVLALRIVPDLKGRITAPLDGRGFALTAVGVAALIVGLEGLSSGFGPTSLALIVAAAALALAVWHLLRIEHPLVDLRILRVASYRATAASGSVYRAVITAIPFLLPLLFQVGFGWSAGQAGAAVIALFVGNVAIKPATTPLMRRFGIRTVLLGSITVGVACLIAMAVLEATTPLPVLLALLFFSGVARSTGFTAYNSVAFADVEPARMNHANTLLSTLQELGAGLGVACGALLLRLGQALPVATGAAGPFRVAFLLLALIMLQPAVSALRMSRTTGDEVAGRNSTSTGQADSVDADSTG